MFGVLIEGIKVFGNLDKSYYIDVALITIGISIALLAYLWSRRNFVKKPHDDLVDINSEQKSHPHLMVSCMSPGGSIQKTNISETNSGWTISGEYLVNKISSIKFPLTFGLNLNLSSLMKYDDLGENCSIGYQSFVQGFYVTAYIFGVHSKDLTEGFKAELELIATSHPELSILSNQEFWNLGGEPVGNNLGFTKSIFSSTGLCYMERAVQVKSFIILTQIGKNYIKIRATWPDDPDFESKFALSTLRCVLMEISLFNNIDIFGLKSARPE